MNYSKLSVKEFLEKSKTGEIDLKGFFEKLYEKIQELNRKYNFFITISDFREERTENGKIKGLPVSVKDNICVKGMRCTAGSRILETYVPVFDATVIKRIRNEGGIITGKTNQDEFGFGTFSTNSGFGVPKNPLDPERTCGGSSGGAAGLTAALNYPHIALGQSTGGSISCPASFCGVVGLTPTYGLVSRYGLIDYANSLDKIGPIGKSVEDVSILLSVISGKDKKDATCAGEKKDYFANLSSEAKGMRIGVPKEYFGEGVDERISETVWNGIKKLESIGMEYEEIELPSTKYALPAYYIIATAEASTNLAKFCGMRYGAEEKIEGSFDEYFSKVRTKYFGEEAKRRILLGTYARMAGYRDKYYLKALQVRTVVIQEFKKAFKKYDALIAPTMPVIAPKFKEIEKMNPLDVYMMDILTVAPNLAGIPMLSVPCGKIQGMPAGMHILGNHFEEQKILNIGLVFEKEVKT